MTSGATTPPTSTPQSDRSMGADKDLPQLEVSSITESTSGTCPTKPEIKK
jgi:hypothetical protein